MCHCATFYNSSATLAINCSNNTNTNHGKILFLQFKIEATVS